ncbi:MAG: hypothetical protein DRN68_08665 [Thaumarchaeota archaeon]|nr:MAG: hypothetical protein DRN68_08665 [Nitrososphaerota archaeon]
MSKRLFLPLTLIALAFFSSVIATPIEKPNHIDPRTIKDFYITNPSLILYYSDILDALVRGNYNFSREILDILVAVGGPNNIKTAVDRANELSRKISQLLENASLSIEKANAYLLIEDREKALEEAFKARHALDEASSIIVELRLALSRLSGLLGVTPGFIAEKIDDLADRIEEMESEYELVMLRIQGLKLKKTKILVDVNPKNVVYGENFTICGRLLTEDNEPVSNATVKVSVGKSGYSTVTNISGFYSLKASVSEYKREVEVVAFYEPEKLKSLRSCLNKTTVEVIFYDTKVLIETPPEAFPGLKAYVNISIEPFEGSRLVNLRFDGLKIASLEIEKPNATLFFEVPERASPGLHVVEVWVEPEGLYAPGYAQSSILVSLKSIDVHWEAPSFVIYPFNKIYFSGFANYYNGTPLSSANVTLYRNGEAVATTLTDAIGFYRFEFYGFSWFPCSEADYELVVEPREPWLEKYSYETRIIEMNLVTFIGSVLLLMAVARSKLPYRTYHMVKSLFKRRREPAKKVEKFGEHVPPLRQVIVKTLRSIEEKVGKEKKRIVATAKYKGRVGLVQWIYFNVLVYFARKLSAIGKSETYREYFRRIALALEYKTKKSFLKLMLMAEAERYGGKKVEVEEANALAEEIIDELEG